jgi:2-polyprenyl-3-methyl-5-hydroxy-6-metoxy-1,4-benzoquinol methylase
MKQNLLGFWELGQVKSKEEISSVYKTKYFDSHNFERVYDPEEFFHKQIPYQEAEFVFLEYLKNESPAPLYSLLDVGCGEGFSLNYFAKRDWAVQGVDYSTDGVSRHFPDLKDKVQVGDLNEILLGYKAQKRKFDLIILNNVLEHVPVPLETLMLLRNLVSSRGTVRIQVPNDFSALQLKALALGCIDREFWIAPHEHLSYFEKDSLKASLRAAGFSRTEALADFPIDINLLNPDSNYIKDSSKGKNCHWQRIHLENLLARKSSEALVTFRRGCGESGLGRNVIVYGRP